MILDLKNIAGAYGESLPFAYEADLSEMEMNGEYPFKTPVTIEGVVKNRLGVLELHGTARALYETQCARCLAPVKVDLFAECDSILSHDAPAEDRDDIYLLEGDFVDLDDLIIPALLMEVNMAYLCKPDCKGLCPKCGADLNQGECGCQTHEVDERLAILKTLLEKKD